MVMQFDEVGRVAGVASKSGFFRGGKETGYAPYSVEQCMIIIMVGLELGLTPIQALREIQIIKGRLVLGAITIASLIRKHERYEYEVIEQTNSKCVIRFSDRGAVLPDVVFTMQDATLAGLLGNEIWKRYPKNLLFARAMTNGARWYCADVFSGSVYTAEELQASETQEFEGPPSFEYKTVNEEQLHRSEKTLTHYDGKLSNGKSTDDYTPEKLKQILTTASTRKKLSARDIELIETALTARSSANGDTEVSPTDGGMDVSGNGEGRTGALRTKVASAEPHDLPEGGEPVEA